MVAGHGGVRGAPDENLLDLRIRSAVIVKPDSYVASCGVKTNISDDKIFVQSVDVVAYVLAVGICYLG